MAVALTKGQPSPPEHRSSRLQAMNWNEIQRPGCYLILSSGKPGPRTPGCVGAGPLTHHHPDLHR